LGLFSFGSQPYPVGLDIGTDHVRVAQVRPSGAGYQVNGYGGIALPMGSVVEGEIVDADAVTRSIRELWRSAGIKGKDVAIGVSNQKVVVRLIDLPYMEKAELEGAIQYQAQDYVPIPVEDAILDFQIIGDYMTPQDEHMMEVLLVAASRDMIEATVSVVEDAGLKLASIDVTTFAIVRALMEDAPPLLPEEGSENEATAVIHISSGITNIAVVEKGVPRFTRVSSLGGSEFTQSIANVLNITFDEAEALKIQVGLPSIDSDEGPTEPGVDPETFQTAQEALEREANKFIAEVRRSLDYYLTQTAQIRTIRQILLTGSGSQLTNLAGYLEKGLQAQVSLADPVGAGRVQVAGAAQASLQADLMGCAPAIGLGMRGPEA
jgi:type IV pilus assembly protein PilM